MDWRKSAISLFLFAIAGSVFATDFDSQTLNYDSNSRGPSDVSLYTETMRTEYRQVRVPYNQRVCRDETRYRRECYQEPPRRVCTNETRRVCENRPVCRTLPNGRRVCQNRRVCRDVPRRVCRQVPGRRVCRDVPYTQRVCRDETRYRYETRPVQVVDRRTQANVNMTFELRANFPAMINFTAELNRDVLNLFAMDRSNSPIVVVSQVTKNTTYNDRNTIIDTQVHNVLYPARDFFKPVNTRPDFLGMAGMNIRVASAPILDTNFTYPRLKLFYNRGLIFDRQLSELDYRVQRMNGQSVYVIHLRNLLGAQYDQYRGQSLEARFSMHVDKNSRNGAAQQEILNSNDFNKWESPIEQFFIDVR